MSANDKDEITEDGAVELDEDVLSETTGGSKWKLMEMDGKSNNFVLEERDQTSWKVTVDNISIGNVRK